MRLHLSTRLPHALIAAGLAVCALACGEPEVPARSYPEGTVLMVGEVPIRAAEVDRWLEAVDLIEPGQSTPGKRRLALTNIVLHRALAQQLDPTRYEETRALALSARERLCAGEGLPSDGPQLESMPEARWKELGIDLWQEVRHAPLGEWAEVLESTAYFVVFRVLARDPEPWSKNSAASIERAIFPYIDEEIAKDVILQAESLLSLEIVDPSWDELVPAHYKYKMGVKPITHREKSAPE